MAPDMRAPLRRRGALPLALLGLTATVIIAAAIGSSDLAPRRALAALIHADDPVAQAILWTIRLPRLAVGALIGLHLALAGALLQTVLRNPLADPAVIGISGGAALTTVLVLVAGDQIAQSVTRNPYAVAPIPFAVLPLVALVGALAATAFIVWVARRGGPQKIILCGIALSATAQALTVGVLAGWGTGRVEGIVAWIAGSLYARDWGHVVALAPWTVAAIIALAVAVRPAALLALGDETATTLGIGVRRTRVIVIALAAVLAASAVSIAGPVGFVGLITPHLARAVVGDDPRRMIPLAAIFGAILVLVADCAGRVVAQPFELPVGVVTALVGAPVCALLQRRAARALFR